MATLKNINFMSKSKYDSVTPSDEELYAVDVEENIITATSKATNGYIKCGNGLIIQWGQTTINKSGFAVTFPIPFTTTNVSVTGNTRGGKYDNYGTCCYSVTTTGFYIYKSGDQTTASWVAIGY